jgi:hypothetical protein
MFAVRPSRSRGVQPTTLPGLFECTSLIDTSHPGGPGGQWIHGARPCGQRFQSGRASGIPCAVSGCGFDSLATCQGGCGRRLCYQHASVCPSCQAEQKRAEAAAKVAAEREATNKRDAIVARLLETTHGAEISELLINNVDILTLADARSVWLSILQRLHPSATHELVTLIGQTTFAGFFTSIPGPTGNQRGSWKETGTRAPLWLASNAGRIFVRGYEGCSSKWTEGVDVVLDTDGKLFYVSHLVWLYLQAPATKSVILDAGATLSLVVERGSSAFQSHWRVLGGMEPRGESYDALSFLRAVAHIASRAAERSR